MKVSDKDTPKEEHIFTMRVYLATLPESVSRDYQVTIQKKLLKKKPSEYLIDYINSSNETDWQTHPVRYIAAFDVLVERGLWPPKGQ